MPPTTSEVLTERYGDRGAPRRSRLVVAAVVLTLLAGIAWALWAGWAHNHQEVAGQLRAYTVTGDTTTEVTVAVQRRTGTAVTCEVFAQAADHSRVGERQLSIPAGEPGTVVVTETITTQRRAVNGVVGECVPTG